MNSSLPSTEGEKARRFVISCTDRVVYANRHFHYTRYEVVVAVPTRHRR